MHPFHRRARSRAGVMFFDEATTRLGAWLHLFGSACFALKPTPRLARAHVVWRRGQVDALARRARD